MAVDTSAVDFALRWTNAFPKPGPGQGVRADALLAAFRQLAPLAERIVGLTVGAAKATYPGAGYLTGKTITQKDVDEARLVLAAAKTVLPPLGATPIQQPLLDTLKAAGQWTLMVGTDLNVTRTLLDAGADAWASKGAVADPLVNLAGGAVEAARRAAEVAWRAATEPWIPRLIAAEAKEQVGVGGLLVTGALVIGGGLVLLKLIGR